MSKRHVSVFEGDCHTCVNNSWLSATCKIQLTAVGTLAPVKTNSYIIQVSSSTVKLIKSNHHSKGCKEKLMSIDCNLH